MQSPSTRLSAASSAPRATTGSATPWLAALVLLLGALLAQPAAAQWVWKDAAGRVTASDRPPPREVADKDVISRPQPESRRAAAAAAAASAPAAAAPAASAAGERELEARKRAADQEKAARTRVEEQKLAEQRAENCRRARGHQMALESGQRIARTNEKGEREILDDKGRAEELRSTREVIRADCGK
jgi:hypothetical protein